MNSSHLRLAPTFILVSVIGLVAEQSLQVIQTSPDESKLKVVFRTGASRRLLSSVLLASERCTEAPDRSGPQWAWPVQWHF